MKVNDAPLYYKQIINNLSAAITKKKNHNNKKETQEFISV